MQGKNARHMPGFRASTIAALTVASLMGFLCVYVLLEGNLTSAPVQQDIQAYLIENTLHEAREELEAMRYKESGRLSADVLIAAPTNATAYNLMGMSLKKQGRIDEAIPLYEEAIRLRRDYYEARNNLAVALEAAGRIREAEGIYLKALQDAPAEPVLHLNYALLLETEGRYDDAIGHYYTFVNLTRNKDMRALVSERIQSLAE